MKRDDDSLALLLGLYLLGEATSRASSSPAPAPALRGKPPPNAWDAGKQAERKLHDAQHEYGASVYDVLHDDAGHKQDLPGETLTRAALLQLATRAGFKDPKLAAAVALAESGGVTGAVNRSSREYSVGLWQINTKKHPYSVDDMKDPLKNARAALAISHGGTDWKPWPTFTNGKYLQFKTGILA